MKKQMTFVLAAGAAAFGLGAAETLLLEGWRFARGPQHGAEAADHADSHWTGVRIPHDWAIAGPFDKEIDKQTVAIVQDGEKTATEKTGRTGALPWIGEGWYRTTFAVPGGAEHVELVFDGAMAEPKVYVDGKEAGGWAIGYNSFRVDATKHLDPKRARHSLAVHLKNVPLSSRWYPGAGLYRPVRLVTGPAVGLETWGTFARTAKLENGSARLAISEKLRKPAGTATPKGLKAKWVLRGPDGAKAGEAEAAFGVSDEAAGVMAVERALAWTPETPHLYTLESSLVCAKSGRTLDSRTTKTGIRTVSAEGEGFKLNGKVRKFKGVCLHHDLGPLGAAFNKSAFRRQVRLLKSMGCDSIRTAHNMPAPWQMDVCDEMGMMVMAESFDMWAQPKCENGYGRFFAEWWKKDIVNLVLNHRNHPSIVMWCIGNEIPEQSDATGLPLTRALQNLCKALDPTRPVTQGIDRADDAVRNGILQEMEVPGLNYRLHKYDLAWTNAPRGLVLGSETASTVSSRGVYKFPVKLGKCLEHSDGQCSSYDVECCHWSNLPDDDWAMQDDRPWTIGEFVWTGFDYLGEPTPYNTYWPSRSSYFGIFDLAGLPKDRYWLYRSRWNEKEPTLHLVPHWTHPGREGKTTPVYCYTTHHSAELFINGKSQGRRFRDKTSRLDRYRLRWNDTVYEPGELKVVAYGENGEKAGELSVETAGRPVRLVAAADRAKLAALSPQDTPDLAFVTVKAVDAKGRECPLAADSVRVKTEGAVKFAAMCNGDATSLEVFTKPEMKLFSGALVAVAEPCGEGAGTVKFEADGLEGASVRLVVEPR